MRNNFDLSKRVDELSDLYIATKCENALEEMIRSLAIMVNRDYKVVHIDDEGFYKTTDLRYVGMSLPKIIFDYEFSDKDLSMLDLKVESISVSNIRGDANYNTIRLAKGLSGVILKEVLIHELVHAAQHRIPEYEFDNAEEYLDRRHEQEAFSISQYIVSKQYHEHIRRTRTSARVRRR